MPIDVHAKVGGDWKVGTDLFVKVGGDWKTVNDQYDKVNGIWRSTDTPAVIPPGVYILSAISQDLVGTSGFSDFDTLEYQGRITEIRLRASWKGNLVNGIDIGVTGRTSGNFYRNITTDDTWENRTIDHRIDTFDAASLTEFNNGTATGFSYSGIGALENTWSNVQLNLTIV